MNTLGCQIAKVQKICGIPDKAGLGYKFDKQQKFYKNFFASTQKNSSSFLTCFDFGKKGHGKSTCYLRKIVIILK